MDEQKQEENRYIEQVALAVIKVLKTEGAVRKAANIKQVPGVYLEDLLLDLDRLGFKIVKSIYYNKVRPKCIELGYDVTANGKGQYIGEKGEAIARNTKNAREQIIGRTKNQRKNLTAASESKTLKEGNEYSKIHFGMNLSESANVFKAVGKAIGDVSLPWPKELHDYLLESSTNSK